MPGTCGMTYSALRGLHAVWRPPHGAAPLQLRAPARAAPGAAAPGSGAGVRAWRAPAPPSSAPPALWPPPACLPGSSCAACVLQMTRPERASSTAPEARAQCRWKLDRQLRTWQPSVAPLVPQILHLSMRPRRTASASFSSCPRSLMYTCAAD